ncbi:MAG: hypothetical protein KBB01_00485 [Candidatus Omnitrophica bacterium]|jgi:hypothetical protein|nr:hypothetical protein [Candidatus Omnitrophota bacterium]
MRSIHKRAQGLVEAGLFGVVILIAFGFLVTFIQKMNSEQYTLMENFRRSLKKSHDRNVILSHDSINDSRKADVEVPLRGEKILRSASGYVHWAVPLITKYTKVESTDQWRFGATGGTLDIYTDEENDPERKFIYEINDQGDVVLDPDADVTGVDREYATAVSESLNLTEDPANISSTRGSAVAEEMTYYIKGATTVEQSRSSGKARSFSVNK